MAKQKTKTLITSGALQIVTTRIKKGKAYGGK